MRILIFLLLLLCIAQMGCRESNTNQPAANSQQTATDSPISSSNSSQANIPAPPETALVKPKVDACALLSGSEIASVQGEDIKETKLSGQNFGGYSISQCFFTLPTFTNSISLMVAQKGDGAGGKDPKEFWQENFHEQAGKKGKRSDGEEGEKEDSAPPKRISGIGDEAFWTGNRVAGALYVLKGEAYIRLSIGGPPNEASMKRSKTLAQKVIARL